VAALAAADVQQLQRLSLQQQTAAEAADLAAAVRSMWALLLQRVGSKQLLEAEVGAVMMLRCLLPKRLTYIPMYHLEYHPKPTAGKGACTV
jgi:hypothetical protein